MNIPITKEEHDYLLLNCKDAPILIGSRMYGTNVETSDTDFLCIYTPPDPIIFDLGTPNIHQFQYKDEATRTDYIWTTDSQFKRNLYSGDSTINADVMFFSSGLSEDKLIQLRTFKIIKAYIGFAKRDIKQEAEGAHKIEHAVRSMYCADELLEGRVPKLSDVRDLILHTRENLFKGITPSVDYLTEWNTRLRETATAMFNRHDLENYPSFEAVLEKHNPVWKKLIDSNNTREFKY